MSYLPLYKGLFNLRSTNGISITATMLLALCAQAQIATMYYLWACPPFKRDGEVVPKPPHSIDYINLLQLLVQWICSILLYHSPTITPSTTLDDSDSAFPSNKSAVTLLIIHASLCIFWALLAGQPRDDWLDLPFVTIMGINQYCTNPLITIATGVASALQASTASRTQGSSALDQSTVLLQAVVFLGLAVSWSFRFRVPQNLYLRVDVWWLGVWYPLVGWTCVNSAVVAVGQGVVMYVTSRAESGIRMDGKERYCLARDGWGLGDLRNLNFRWCLTTTRLTSIG
ncbi:hypothetical protein GQ44DRAFT_680393 [Phaeosphaeriaceae sp. PMI808]|nr:hypothetical protein GQ44DRAFT_680393 [Phaeosphaeriaceae sp. PMI808]